MTEFTGRFLSDAQTAIDQLNKDDIERMVKVLFEVRESGGRLFFLGVGGGAGNATHAVNDFRKIARIESYAPTDNVSELTAWINDDSWENCYLNILRGSRLCAKDAVFVFSVGGGSRESNLSTNIISALKWVRQRGVKILGVVGRDGGYTAEVADACVVVPTISVDMITPLVEALQMLVSHLIVSHPLLKMNETKWEATAVTTLA